MKYVGSTRARPNCTEPSERSSTRPVARASLVLIGFLGFLGLLGSGGGAPAAGAAVTKRGTLTCSWGTRTKQMYVGMVCTLIFKDRGARTGSGATPAAGHQVCFSTPAPNRVHGTTGTCTTTSKGGRATGKFVPVAAGTATITAAESFKGINEGTASISVNVKK